jgi:hypothetical protein
MLIEMLGGRGKRQFFVALEGMEAGNRGSDSSGSSAELLIPMKNQMDTAFSRWTKAQLRERLPASGPPRFSRRTKVRIRFEASQSFPIEG